MIKLSIEITLSEHECDAKGFIIPRQEENIPPGGGTQHLLIILISHHIRHNSNTNKLAPESTIKKQSMDFALLFHV